MQIISYIQKLVPHIEDLSLSLSAIASILKAIAEAAETVSETKAQRLAKNQQVLDEQSPTSQPSVRKMSVSTPDSSAGSSDAGKPAVTIEQVRAVLAEKSQAGLTMQVKDLLTSFGSVKLSGIDPARYGELIEAAKALQ